MFPLGILITGLALTALAPWAVRVGRSRAALALSIAPAAIAVGALFWAAQTDGRAPLTFEAPWIPALGLRFGLQMDGLACVFVTLIAAVGAAICVYAGTYLRDHAHLGRFMAYLLGFMTAMWGIVLADNLLLLYVFWELTTVSSWLLIGFEHEKPQARGAAWQALMTTAAAGLAMLAGFVLLGQLADTFVISELLGSHESIQQSTLYAPAALLIVVGAAAKSAQVPLHFWLPNAMAAPTPVSAYLHSATMVKAGIYLLARMSPALGGTTLWTVALCSVGGLTAVVGAWLALQQTDAKRLLAYTTISALGMMTLSIGLGSPAAMRAAVVLLTAHALYKGALFMVAGAWDHGAGSRDLTRLGALRRKMPKTSAASVLAMASMVGLPPTLGFLAEEALVKASLKSAAWAVPAAVIVAGTLYTAAGFVVGLRPVLHHREPLRGAHDPHAGLWLPPLIAAIAGVALALFPGAWSGWFVAPATQNMAGSVPDEPLRLWHGLTIPFGLGAAMLGLGAALAWFWDPVRKGVAKLSGIARWGPDRAYHLVEQGLRRVAGKLDRVLQHGYLPGYLVVVVLSVITLTGSLLLRAAPRVPWSVLTSEPSASWILLALMLTGASFAVAFRSRLTAVIGVSVVGYTMATFFALYSAPDLAITQVLVETLLTALVVLLLPRLPRLEKLQGKAVRLRDGVIALSLGCLVTTFLLVAHASSSTAEASSFYVEHSASAGGANVVNLILINFRAIDTLGEVTVLGAAALSVVTLMVATKEARSWSR